MSRRKYERTACQTEAIIRYKNSSIKGEVENLSLKGLFVKTDLKIDVDEEVEVSIYFHGADSDLSFSLQATVIRVAENGLGFNFQKIDVDTLALQKREQAPEPAAPSA